MSSLENMFGVVHLRDHGILRTFRSLTGTEGSVTDIGRCPYGVFKWTVNSHSLLAGSHVACSDNREMMVWACLCPVCFILYWDKVSCISMALRSLYIPGWPWVSEPPASTSKLHHAQFQYKSQPQGSTHIAPDTTWGLDLSRLLPRLCSNAR